MKELTEDTIKQIFGNTTFFKGQDYYKNGHARGTVKLEDTLFAQVMGSSHEPYEVRALIKDSEISTKCTCPVGNMCKHGTALLLKWVFEPSSFIDADRFLESLDGISKDEIINMIGRAIKQHPSLVIEFTREEREKPRINIDAISKKIAWITSGELDYYHIDDAIDKLDEIKNIADRLKEEKSFKDAADIYFVLVEGCVDAFDEGADDSNGSMGDFAISCIKDFNECVEQINDPAYKNTLLGKIMNLARIEDYGLEASDMLLFLINDENIKRVEEYFLEKLEETRKIASDSSYRYHKEKSLGILNGLYEKLGKPDERLRLAMYALVDKEDYYRLAKILFEKKRFEEAFDAAKKGLLMPGESHYLNDLYFDIARALIGLRPEIIDFNISLNVALDLMSGCFDEEKYIAAKEVFEAIGNSGAFRSAFYKTIKNRSSAVLAMLKDGELQAAIDTVRTEPNISQGTTIAVSRAALDKGMKQESAMLMRTALERGRINDLLKVGELLKVMIDVSEVPVLQSLCDRILKNKDRGTALLLMPYLLKKSPELSALLAKNFMKDIPVEMVIKVALSVAQKSPDEGALLCRLRINQDILQSHVHYDKAVSLLSAVREIYAGNEPEWQEFIRKFAAENKSKKKLIEMVRKEFKVVL
ncbi:MAG: hypothetical protein OIN84_15140 [Candidatus Methanoperedens sp.]|uniref:SWIM zinc finger family protein n=1 Tax=Candidatus Methanoperedens sp. BLZ2 TaxID=2035255 RepID=UPI000BE3861C|nr:hypothetical protein [Candidatus Methanoperedens sp. BLZ2]KAB2946740.1 MAG: hypothetical protein F9K14_06190 [Candidatus Methanoperedens sp.]MBZ0175840.1 hypothetical protein [Candidatus Methanoperedens nitroreducens]MCX9079298.1 hypothetical protein [Candidatus Methanoperedens sp.]